MGNNAGLTAAERQRIIEALAESGDLGGFEGFVGFVGTGEKDLSKFPPSTLPEKLDKYSQQIEESLQVTNEMVSPVLLSAASLCSCGHYWISPKADWKEPLNLYTMIISKPSERKSPVLKEVFTPIYDYVDRVNKEREPDIMECQTKKIILSRQIEEALKSVVKKTHTPTKPSKPTKPISEVITTDKIVDMKKELAELEENMVKPLTLLADDVTTEALVKLLNENDERIAIASAEGGIFGMLAGRYSSHPNIDIFLKGYSGEAYTSHRVSGRIERLREPLINLTLMVQPVVLSEALNNKEFMERGLMARFLYSVPGTKVGKRRYNTMAIDEKVRQDFHDLIDGLLELREWDHPKYIYVSDEANALGEEFFNEIETELFSKYEDMSEWIGKLYGQTMRVAGILHVLDHLSNSHNVKVDADTMRRAILIGRYYLSHAKYVFLQSGMYDPPEVKNAKYILNRIDSTGKTQISKRDVFYLCRDKVGFEKADSEAFVSGLEELRRRGYIKIERVSSPNGGRPTELIALNPIYIAQREE